MIYMILWYDKMIWWDEIIMCCNHTFHHGPYQDHINIIIIIILYDYIILSEIIYCLLSMINQINDFHWSKGPYQHRLVSYHLTFWKGQPVFPTCFFWPPPSLFFWPSSPPWLLTRFFGTPPAGWGVLGDTHVLCGAYCDVKHIIDRNLHITLACDHTKVCWSTILCARPFWDCCKEEAAAVRSFRFGSAVLDRGWKLQESLRWVHLCSRWLPQKVTAAGQQSEAMARCAWGDFVHGGVSETGDKHIPRMCFSFSPVRQERFVSRQDGILQFPTESDRSWGHLRINQQATCDLLSHKLDILIPHSNFRFVCQ